MALHFRLYSRPNPPSFTWGTAAAQYTWDMPYYPLLWCLLPILALPILAFACAWSWREWVRCLAIVSLAFLAISTWATIRSFYSGVSLSAYHSWHEPGTYCDVGANIWFMGGGVRVGIQTSTETRFALGNPDVDLRVGFCLDSRSAPHYPINRVGDITGKPDVDLGAGFAYHDATNGPGGVFHCHPRYIVIPCWFLLLALAIFPTIHIVHRVRFRETRLSSHCEKCGYDLRASKARCPECGTPFVKN